MSYIKFKEFLSEQGSEDIKITGAPVSGVGKPETIGIVDPAQYNSIKNRVKGITIVPLVKDILSQGGKWSGITGFETLVVDPIANAFAASGLPASVLEELKLKKNELNGFENTVKKGGVFSMVDVITNDVTKHLKVKPSGVKEKLHTIYNDAFNIIGSIATVGVGKGEIATSFFTNTIKGKVGDLESPDATQIELKGTGGRLGKASYSATQTAKELANFAERNNITALGGGRGSAGVVAKLKEHFIAMQQKYPELFKDGNYGVALRNNLNKAINDISNISLDSLGFKVKSTIEKNILNAFIQNGYVSPERAQLLKDKIIDFFKVNNSVLVDAQKKLANASGKVLSLDELRSTSFTTAVQDFFLTDLGLTPEQAAEAFLLTRSVNVDLSEYNEQIISFFKKNYTKLMHCDVVTLKAAVFAMHGLCYYIGTGKHINYLLIVNSGSNEKKAVSISFNEAELFTSLSQQYLNNAPNGLFLVINSDPQQGASGVSIK